MSYDPAFDAPHENWAPQSPFLVPQIPPAVRPDAGTPVCIGPIAQEWLDWLVGACDAGKVPKSWIVADDAAQYQVQSDVDTLKALIAVGRCTAVAVETRLQDCVLQTSVDAGVTWVDVPGWTTDFADCVRMAIPPPPPPIPGVGVAQYACNVAGFLAQEIIKLAMANAVTAYNTGVSQLQYASDLSNAILAEGLPFANLFVQAVNVFYGLFTAGTIAMYTAAASDPALWAELTCAIYNAIKVQGYVTPGNFAAVLNNISFMGYSSPTVVSDIYNFVATLGVTNVQALQIRGALDQVDCSGCGSWCLEADFTLGSFGTGVYPGSFGTYTAGCCYGGSWDAALARWVGGIQWVFAGAIAITQVNIGVRNSGTFTPGVGARQVVLYNPVGTPVQANLYSNGAVGGLTQFQAVFPTTSATELAVFWGEDANPGSFEIAYIQIIGTGTDPDPGHTLPCTH